MTLKRILWFIIIFTIAFYIVINSKNDTTINLDKGEKMEKEDVLISREILFGNPDKIAVRLSNDGKYISFIAPHEGVMNIWVAPTDKIDEAKVITNEKERGIRSYFWAKDNQHIIYAQDRQGDENWCLYSVRPDNEEQIRLTPGENVRASLLKSSINFPDKILILMNDRVPEYFDIYQMDITNGKHELIYENQEKYTSFWVDDEFKIRLGYKMLPSGESEIYSFENGDLAKAKLFQKVSVEDMLTTSPLHISNDGNKLFMIDSSGRNTSALIEIDLSSNTRKIVYENQQADIDDYLLDPKTKLIQAVATNYLRKTWTILDSEILQDIENIKAVEEGDIEIISKTYDDNKWIVSFLKSDGPHKYYLYDRTTKETNFLFVSNAKQENLPFSRMYPLNIKSRDGLDLVSYLTIPNWLDNGQGVPSEPVPLVLFVHGGPNARDEWGFNPVTQWLANRGYAVLSVNYRGSTGFGKNFINAGDGEWAGKMQNDLEDGVQWCIENQITEKDKIIIMGGSYGGYAALVGMSMTPELYAAGIDIVGPSNLETLLNSIPPYWKPQIAHLNKIIGATTETKEGKEFLKSRSPLTYAKDIKKPLLIVQGANDPRVKQAESDQIVKAMKEHSVPVVYLLYPDEGHGLARPENKLSMYANAEVFLANFANGRFIPHNNNFPGSSIEVKEGQDITWTRTKE
jgi:dipeptidyl aminopeptidase/acylaminoacyl peptidase